MSKVNQFWPEFDQVAQSTERVVVEASVGPLETVCRVCTCDNASSTKLGRCWSEAGQIWADVWQVGQKVGSQNILGAADLARLAMGGFRRGLVAWGVKQLVGGMGCGRW